MIPGRRLADFLELPERLATSLGRTTLFIRKSPLRNTEQMTILKMQIRLECRVVHRWPGNPFYWFPTLISS
jgi:hypothetical protein